MMMDTDTKRYYWIYDFKKVMKFEDGFIYCVSGKVNSADRIYLVAENMKVKSQKKYIVNFTSAEVCSYDYSLLEIV